MPKGATSKRTRKIQEYKQEYSTKKAQILNIRKLLKNSNLRMAKSCIDNYLEDYGKDGYILHELGKYNYQLNNFDEAKYYYESVIYDDYENKYYSMYELSKIEKINNNLDRSLELLNEIIESDHKNKCHAKLEKAKICYILNDYDESLKIITNLILTDQENKVYAFDALMDYALDFFNGGIAKKFYILIEKDLKEEEKLYYSALIDKMYNKIEPCKEKLEELSHTNTDFKYRAKYQLAILAFEGEKYLEAIDLAECVCNEYPGLIFGCYRLLASTYMILKEYEKSEYYIHKLEETGVGQDYMVNELYGNLYFNKQQYDKAVEYFLKVECGNKEIYYEAKEKIGFILIKQKQYEKALEYFNNLAENDCTDKFKLDCLFSKLFLKKQLGIEITEQSNLYSANQIINYDKEEAIKHIEKHKQERKDKTVHSLFSDNIDIRDLYDYAIANLNEDNYTYNNFMDIYTLDYPNIGIANGKLVNYLTVVVLPNTKQIITMYPHDKVVLNSNKKTSKVKKMSRIDKFKQKYGV